MLFPALYRENLFDGLDPFDRMLNGQSAWGLEFPSEKRDPLFGKHAARVMRTDIRELKTGYEIDIDLPGFKKEDVTAELEDGYLTISAGKSLERKGDEKEHGHYLRRERYEGSCSRSFYVGDAVKEEDVKAKFEDGILKISIPKKEAATPEKRMIAIE